MNRLAASTKSKRSNVIKDALADYHDFVHHIATGDAVLARPPSGTETRLATPEFAVLQSQASELKSGEGARGLLRPPKS